jgi:hypothetical protein
VEIVSRNPYSSVDDHFPFIYAGVDGIKVVLNSCQQLQKALYMIVPNFSNCTMLIYHTSFLALKTPWPSQHSAIAFPQHIFFMYK